MSNIKNIVDNICNLKLSEIKELGDAIAKELGYNSLDQMISSNVSSSSNESAGEEDDSSEKKAKMFKISLVKFEPKLLTQVIKRLRDLTNCSLFEAKSKATQLPVVIKDEALESEKDLIVEDWKKIGIDLEVVPV